MVSYYATFFALLMLLGNFRLGMAESCREMLLSGIKEVFGESVWCEGFHRS